MMSHDTDQPAERLTHAEIRLVAHDEVVRLLDALGYVNLEDRPVLDALRPMEAQDAAKPFTAAQEARLRTIAREQAEAAIARFDSATAGDLLALLSAAIEPPAC